MKNLQSIGDFARATRMSIKALRRYDELGLLKPAHTDADSGYRYYSNAQLIDAERIRQLRSVEMPLAEIGALLRDADSESVRRRLDEHRIRLAKRLENMQASLRFFEKLMNQGQLMQYEVNKKETVEQNVVKKCAKANLQTIGPVIHQAIGAIYAYIDSVGARPLGPPGTVYIDDDLVEEEEMEVEVFVPVDRMLAGNHELDGATLRGETMAYTLHRGPFQEVGPAYPAILDWMKQHNLKPAGPPREVYLAKGESPAEQRAEIQWPVTNI